MKINFHKYQGTGNDFVMVDNRELDWSPTSSEVQKICDRKFGIGSDGLILIQDHDDYDFEMIYFNSDGSKSLCGNGSRCAIHFSQFLGIIEKATHFLTTDGIHEGKIENNLISFEIFDVPDLETIGDNYFVNTGSPHYVTFLKDLESIDVNSEGKRIRYSEKFQPDGTNVNFVEVTNQQSIKVCTYERGVEDETLSCGTGVTAAALAASNLGVKSPVKVITRGGELTISFEKSEAGFKNIRLSGPATFVFEGSIDL